MFGHMRAPVPAYKVAFDNSRTFVEQSSDHQEEIAERLAETAANFDQQEELAVQIAEGINK
ncbi:hypothetical protein G7085_00765 [Tessaracoccus sp. HDW20]|uniref:hypothetical protein n=1 Tax=Tessaracoccus coleopterorum TaxID=2714950 RepID=UPI0018D46BBA|nr:hypothetical protein [Tessaracoccus coleopterorum]NHB83725.1 hypothetical protein [Tessaracoccus coleopterorum]